MIGSTGEAFHEVLADIRRDLSTLQTRFGTLIQLANDLNIEDKPPAACPHCGLKFKWQAQRDEHVYTSHDGPVPQHWIDAEERSADPWVPPKDGI